MRIIYIDLDSQRPDHLGCYGYHRNTSPNIDRLAAQGVRFTNCYVPDAPCLPSRSALFSGRCGIRTGVVNHGGVASEMHNEGPSRQFRSELGTTNWMTCLRNTGHHTCAISPFGERHSAWHWYAGMNEIHNTGGGGMEGAEVVYPVVEDWLKRNAHRENYFLHVNFWDAHTPYRTPANYQKRFADDPIPAWYTQKVLDRHRAGSGAHSAREVCGFGDSDWERSLVARFPQQPGEIRDMNDAHRMFDGYDRGVAYTDEMVGRMMNLLADQGVLEDTAVIISADHGENLGELNIYGDHQTADHITSRVPLIVRMPGMSGTGRVDPSLIYSFDFAATLIELTGGKVPDNWDGRAFTGAFKSQRAASHRDHLVVSQGAWCVQRAVRWGNQIAIRTWQDALQAFPEWMLFDVEADPHEQNDLAGDHPEVIGEASRMLDRWTEGMLRRSVTGRDPFHTVMSEGGTLHANRSHVGPYLQRLRATGRPEAAGRIERRYPWWVG